MSASLTTPGNLHRFSQEIADLLVKYGIGTYLFGCVVQDGTKDTADMPLMFSVTGDPDRGILPQRLAAALCENLLGALIRMLMHYCGLTLHQAVGAVGESVKYAAGEIEQQLEDRRTSVSKANMLPDA